MKMRSVALWMAVACMTTGIGTRADEEKTSDPTLSAQRLLRDAGAVTFAHKKAYGAGIADMWLGYGEDGRPIVGVATRQTKTYAEALAVIAVTPNTNGYAVAAAEIPTVNGFHGKSKTLTLDALKNITGRVFKDGKEARGLVDAVTGATQYYKAIYVSYALMASKVIKELEANPKWPRHALSKAE